MSMSHEFFSSYSLATFSATFLIIYGDASETNIGCVSVPITPYLGNFTWMLTFLPFAALLFVGFATVLAAIYSPWGTTDIFMWSSNHGRDVDLLRLVTPGFGDCLQYIQFAALTGALSLNYPGFYQPVASQVAWSSLMFNQSFVSKGPAYESMVDGIYVTNSTRGLVRYSQLVGLSQPNDVWAGMMVWLLVIAAGVIVLTQLGFIVHRLYRLARSIPEEDLRSKNIPFSLGNIVRVAFNYFLLPIVALSTFQLVAAGESPAYVVALSVVTLAAIIGFTVWLLRVIIRARPRSDLFDDLPTVLLYGPLYNTYTDAAAGFALVPILLGILRGIAIGGLQASGIAQIAILASVEVVQLLTIVYFRPFDSQTSMNAYHSLFSLMRLITTLLMIAFAPSLGVTEGPKGWVGYVILVLHGGVLVFGFFLNALQTLIEVVARLLGAGGDDMRGLTRGGLSKIFGMRQLSRRMSRRHHGGVSRQSQLSTTAMLDVDRNSKTGYVMPGGRLRSESVASIGGLMSKQHRSSSALDSIDVYSGAPASSFTPTTPGEANPFSFLPSPSVASRPAQAAVADNAMEPYYYRPPRRRRETLTDSINSSNLNRVSLVEPKQYAQGGAILGDPNDLDAALSRGATPAPHGSLPINLAPRADYTTREVDFYYGVRGPALNSERPGRKLGTGPADPTGPVATAQSWFRSFLSGKTKDKGKGFEVVRSARMPPAMRMQAGLDGDPAIEGVPVAMSNLRNGPNESDDEADVAGASKIKRARSPATLLNERGEPQDMDVEGAEMDDLEAPGIPRKSSKRHSDIIDYSAAPSFNLIPPVSPVSPPTSPIQPIQPISPPRNGHASQPSFSEKQSSGAPMLSRLPFERTGSMRHNSSVSSMDLGDDFTHIDLHREETSRDKPTSGHVTQHSISRVEPEKHHIDLLGSSAELVDDQYASSRGGSADGRR